MSWHLVELMHKWLQFKKQKKRKISIHQKTAVNIEKGRSLYGKTAVIAEKEDLYSWKDCCYCLKRTITINGKTVVIAILISS